MTEIKEAKRIIRDEYRAARRAVPSEKKAEMDARICERFLALAAFRYAGTVLLYAPLENEIDVMPIAQAALDAGKITAFPRCHRETRTVTFHAVSSLSMLAPDNYGIREPSADLPELDTDASGTVCVVPALVFDGEGYRIGYGGGYYDRFLNTFSGTTIGPIYSDFIIDRVPRGRYDAAVNTLLTEKGVITLNV